MTDLRQAAQQALEAYDKTAMNSFVQNLYDEKMQEGKHGHYETMFHVVHEAVKRFAPPQQQAEPVCPECKAAVLYECVACSSNNYPPSARGEQQQAEPVAFYDFNKGFYWAKPTKIVAPTVVDVPPIPLYTTAAKREWIGLTPEEILDLFDVNNVYGSKWIEFARTVEAKLKEKNT